MRLVAEPSDDLAAQRPIQLALRLRELAFVGRQRRRRGLSGRRGPALLGAAAGFLLLAALAFELGQQRLDALGGALELGGGGLVFLALGLDLGHRLLLLLRQVVEAFLLLLALVERLVDFLVRGVEPPLVPLDLFLFFG